MKAQNISGNCRNSIQDAEINEEEDLANTFRIIPVVLGPFLDKKQLKK